MIHKYSQCGYNIVLDVHSGAVHVLDKLSFKLLDYTDADFNKICPEKAYNDLSEYSREEVKECYSELYDLYNKGLLYSSDNYEQFACELKPAPIKSMCLNIAHDCNLRCEYCFAAKGDFGKGRELMSLETAKKAIDFLIENSEGRRNLELDFFGGEPLMNFDVVKQVVEYARIEEKKYNKNFRFTITTNGLLLDDEKIKFINKEMSNVVLSIDGRKEINDLLRITANGKGSYDTIIDKYKKLVKNRDREYYVRGTFTKFNLDFTNDVLHLYNLGFDQISVEPVVSEPMLPYSIKENDLQRIYEEYDRLAEKVLELKSSGKQINFFHFMIDLDNGPCAIKRLRGCSCGNEYVAITPNGDIYPCHQFVGMDDYKLGNINVGSFDNNMKKNFSSINIYKKDECKECWAKFYCSGGCSANNLQYAGDIMKPHKLSCQLEKKRLECAFMIKAAINDR